MEINKISFLLRISKYGYDNDSFTLKDLIRDLSLNDDETQFLVSTLTSQQNSSANPNHILVLFKIMSTNTYENFYKILPSAYFSYIDHLEIIEARKAAKEAKRLATWSLWISSALAAISIIVGIIQILK